MSWRSILQPAVLCTGWAAQEAAAPPASQAGQYRILKDAFEAGMKAESAKDWPAALASLRQAAASAGNRRV